MSRSGHESDENEESDASSSDNGSLSQNRSKEAKEKSQQSPNSAAGKQKKKGPNSSFDSHSSWGNAGGEFPAPDKTNNPQDEFEMTPQRAEQNQGAQAQGSQRVIVDNIYDFKNVVA